MRKSTWAIIGWSALCLVWAVAYMPKTYCFSALCSAVAEAQKTQFIQGNLMGWFIGTVLLSLVWFASRPSASRG